MLEKFLNKKVEIIATAHGSMIGLGKSALFVSGTITGVDANFIELDNNSAINIKYIISIKSS